MMPCKVEAEETKLLPKRTMALHVAYVGSSFKGSAVNRALGEAATIEAVLESALHKAGFISDDNFGHFDKVKWSRASRTDKGVHSLGTVIGLRINMDDSSQKQDTEGITIADQVNAHLPSMIRVLCVQKVNKKFNARHYCSSRSYEYYLPCSMIDVKADGSSEASDKDKIERFRAALKVFEGNRAYHNYTKVKPHDGQRDLTKRYSIARQAEAAAARERGEDPRVPAEVIKAEMKRQAQEAKAQEAKAQESGSYEARVPSEPIDTKEVQESVPQGALKKRDREEDDDNDNEDDEGEEGDDDASEDEEDASGSKRQKYKKGSAIRGSAVSFKAQGAHVTSTYYRRIASFTAYDPEPLTPGGIPCLRLQVTGQSFLLHHIRHMIGSAIAVTLGALSMEAVEASFAPPSRISLPLAPSHTLLLSDCDFRDFPVSFGSETGDLEILTGARLSLRTSGVKRKEDFRCLVLEEWFYFSFLSKILYKY